jgi:bisphosphoglycerate-independent phosphoglycerate mutase (AlkP superfamily)
VLGPDPIGGSADQYRDTYNRIRSHLLGWIPVIRDAIGAPVTAHSLNPVPFVLVGHAVAGRHLADGVLADVAPTLLELAGLPGWPGITGVSLLRQ